MTSSGRDSDFPDTFASFNKADPVLGYGLIANPSPINVTRKVNAEETLAYLANMIMSIENMHTLSETLHGGLQAFLTKDTKCGVDGNSIMADIQLLQRSSIIFCEALGIITGNDVLVKDISDVEFLIKLKEAGLWKHAIILIKDAKKEIIDAATDAGITVRTVI